MAGFTIKAEVAEAVRRFEVGQNQLRLALLSPVTQDLARRAIRVEAAAKEYATGVGGGPEVRTGRLRGSITWRIGMDEVSPYADIGSAVFYAPFVELGHNIVRGGVIYGWCPPRPFLRPALAAAAGTI